MSPPCLHCVQFLSYLCFALLYLVSTWICPKIHFLFFNYITNLVPKGQLEASSLLETTSSLEHLRFSNISSQNSYVEGAEDVAQ
jgi:hypothetical protein